MSHSDDRVEEFSWRAHPARECAGRATAAVLVIAALAFLAALLMRSSLWGVLAATVLMVALNRFFFPSRFAIDKEGITAHHPLRRQRLRWADLRRFAHDETAGFLSTRSRRSWLDSHRGMNVLFGDQRQSVIARIRGHLPEGARSWPC